MKNNNEKIMKVIIIGDSCVGKTFILSRFIKETIPENPASTIGMEFFTKDIETKDGTVVKVQLWDTAGQEKYRAICRKLYKEAIGVVLVYDLLRKETYDHCRDWLEEIEQNCDKQPKIIMVGNKQDMINKNNSNRGISYDEAKLFASSNNLLYNETSALIDKNINDSFQILFEEILNSKKNEFDFKSTKKIKIKNINKNKKGCC